MIFVIARISILSALAFNIYHLSVSPAHASSVYYSATWIIDPIEPKLGTIIAKPGDVITEARLVPKALLVLDADATRVDGKPSQPSGTQLMLLQSSIISACTYTFPLRDALQSFFKGSQSFTCFVDEDGDGSFESAFELMSSRIGVPPPYGKIPKNRIAITPVAYHRVSIEQGHQFPRLLYKYSHQDKITGHSYFGVCIANSINNKQLCFDGYSGVRSDKIPKEIGAAGNIAIATSKEGSAVTLEVKHGFARMPFSGEERTVWVVY